MTGTLTLCGAAADTVAGMLRRPLRPLLAVVAVFGAIAAVGAASASAQSVLPGGQVPIKVFHSRTGAAAVLVPVSIGRGHGYFILDTGAEKSMIDQRVAKQLGLRPVGRKHVLCGITGCNRPTRSVSVAGWQLGSVALPPTSLAQGNLLALFPGPMVAAGLLGADMLSAYGKINIDFANSLLTLGDGNPIATPPPPSAPAPSTPATPGSGLVAH
jgi:gag-polyprotein putative aspartyl protease